MRNIQYIYGVELRSALSAKDQMHGNKSLCLSNAFFAIALQFCIKKVKLFYKTENNNFNTANNQITKSRNH